MKISINISLATVRDFLSDDPEASIQTQRTVEFDDLESFFDELRRAITFTFPQPPTNVRCNCVNSGTQKINAIKVFRELSGKGLKEAKDFVEGVGGFECPSKKGEHIVSALREVGAEVKLTFL